MEDRSVFTETSAEGRRPLGRPKAPGLGLSRRWAIRGQVLSWRAPNLPQREPSPKAAPQLSVELPKWWWALSTAGRNSRRYRKHPPLAYPLRLASTAHLGYPLSAWTTIGLPLKHTQPTLNPWPSDHPHPAYPRWCTHHIQLTLGPHPAYPRLPP